MDKERYINLSDRQVKDTQNQSQDFLSVRAICRLLNNQDKKIADLEAKLAESEREKQTLIKGEYKKCCEDCCAFDEQVAIANDYLNECNQLKQQLAETDKLMQEYLSKCLSLEQQLAEKDQAIEGLQEINQSLGQTCNNDAKEIERLNKLLAEKEKEIEELNHKLNVEQPCLLMNYKDMVDMLKNSQNQTAIAELEKLKKDLEFAWSLGGFEGMSKSEVFGFIDQQIKSLKGEEEQGEKPLKWDNENSDL